MNRRTPLPPNPPTVVVIGSDMRFTTIVLSDRDAAFIESLRFEVAPVRFARSWAEFFGVEGVVWFKPKP